MGRKCFFWAHLVLGVAAGVFIFVMAATGVVLAFERQIADFVNRDVRWVSVPATLPSRPLSNLLESVIQSSAAVPEAIVVRNAPQATIQFSIGRGKAIYVDPYSGAILGPNSERAHEFFFEVERLHRALGAPLGSKSLGHWLIAISNLLFGWLILFGVVLWLPRKWSAKAIRSSITFRRGLRSRARHFNWHNVLGIWCAVPLLVIVLTGVVMSFPWANGLLFRLSGSNPPVRSRGPAEGGPRGRDRIAANGPNYDHLLTTAKSVDPHWRTITLTLVRDAKSPVQVIVDSGSGGQPQKRTQYLLNRDTAAILKTTTFGDGSLGQRLRAFVRFGHTGEWGGWPGQLVAALVSLGACVLVYTGLSLSIRRLMTRLNRNTRVPSGRVLAHMDT